ncbi:unnamed protein product [Effrenium voratum]|uniref:Uncharacterized protein n=1 Tax=Effrenium voratum TaxID=2562239 RepID=A0AA36MT20_9DINO|nr:unnamed protein product [Effrenium voratum]CAJ1379005.1 unnamed protein product [Effrenium voratum]CAJ1426156.1 unnamed protein product [Effrenium voratum]
MNAALPGSAASPDDDATVDVAGVVVKLPNVPEEARLGCEDVTGFQLWHAATRAAAQELRPREGRLLLELGCGLGALGSSCRGFVVLTDKELPVLRLAQRTGHASGARFDAVAFDFTRGRQPWRSGCFDTVMAADVLFMDRLAEPLFNAFAHHGLGTVGVLGHQRRRAVFRGPDGQPCLEPEDSALQKFLERAASHVVQMTEHEDEESVGLVMEWPARAAKRTRLE